MLSEGDDVVDRLPVEELDEDDVRDPYAVAEAHVLAVVVADGMFDNVIKAESDRESVTVAQLDMTLEYEPVPVADFEGVPVVLDVIVTEKVNRIETVCEDEVLIEAVVECVRVPSFGEIDAEAVILRVADPVRELITVRDELGDDDNVNVSETLTDDDDVADVDNWGEELADSECRDDFVFIAVIEGDEVADTDTLTERDTVGEPDEVEEAISENELYDRVESIDSVGLTDEDVDIVAEVQTVLLNNGELDEDDDTFDDPDRENKAEVDGDGERVRAITVTLRWALREAEDCGELLVVIEALRLIRDELDCDNDVSAEREYDACVEGVSFSVRVELTLIVPVVEVERVGVSVPLILTRPLRLFDEMGDSEIVALGEDVMDDEPVSVKGVLPDLNGDEVTDIEIVTLVEPENEKTLLAVGVPE